MRTCKQELWLTWLLIETKEVACRLERLRAIAIRAFNKNQRPHEWGRGTQECVRHVHFHAIMVIKEETIAAQNAAAVG